MQDTSIPIGTMVRVTNPIDDHSNSVTWLLNQCGRVTVGSFDPGTYRHWVEIRGFEYNFLCSEIEPVSPNWEFIHGKSNNGK